MRILLFFIATLLLGALSFAAIYDNKEGQVSPNLSKVLKTVTNEAYKKYQIKAVGVGIAAPDDVLMKVGISFQIESQLKKGEARRIVLELSRLLRDEINANKTLVEHMQSPPFTLNNVCVELFFTDKNGDEPYHPDWGVISFSYGEFNYITHDPNNRFKYFLNEREDFPDE